MIAGIVDRLSLAKIMITESRSESSVFVRISHGLDGV